MESGPGNSLAASAPLSRRPKDSIPPTSAAPATPNPSAPRKRRRLVPARVIPAAATPAAVALAARFSFRSDTLRQLHMRFSDAKILPPGTPNVNCPPALLVDILCYNPTQFRRRRQKRPPASEVRL